MEGGTEGKKSCMQCGCTGELRHTLQHVVELNVGDAQVSEGIHHNSVLLHIIEARHVRYTVAQVPVLTQRNTMEKEVL